MVVNLIMRPCRLRSFANQTGPRRSETSGRADLSGTGHPAAQRAIENRARLALRWRYLVPALLVIERSAHGDHRAAPRKPR